MHKVLLIEDNPVDADLTKEYLASQEDGYQIEWVEELSSGMTRLEKGNGVDVILLDLQLPDSEGLNSFYKIHNNFSNIPVVLLTGLNDQQSVSQALQAGAQDYIVKGSFNGMSLSRSINYAIERHRLIMQTKHYMRNLEAMKQELERSNEQLSSFVQVVSHDLYEPIRTIKLYSERLILGYKDKLDAKGSRTLGFITNAISRMNNLVRTLLNYSKVGQGEINFEPVSMDRLVEQVMQNLELKIKESDAQINYPTLPIVQGNKMQLMQLVQNLIANSIKFCERKPEINISYTEEDDYYKFIFADNGIGIEKSKQEEVFKPFIKINDRRDGNSCGLGLSICKQVVENHGGSIILESELSQGSQFVFTLQKSKHC